MTPRLSTLELDEDGKRSVARALVRARGSIGLAIDTIIGLDGETRAGLWPHATMDSCEPERDLRDALAHVNAALGYTTAEAKR